MILVSEMIYRRKPGGNTPSCPTSCPNRGSYKLMCLDGKRISGFQDSHSSKIRNKNIYNSPKLKIFI
jgi:hypothetical protein